MQAEVPYGAEVNGMDLNLGIPRSTPRFNSGRRAYMAPARPSMTRYQERCVHWPVKLKRIHGV